MDGMNGVACVPGDHRASPRLASTEGWVLLVAGVDEQTTPG